MRTFALIPAAGHSTRMGRPKLSLPLGDRTLIEHVVGTLRAAGIADILVVVGPHIPELVPLAERAGAQVLPLREATADMRATVEHGLRWLQARFRPRDDDTWLLVPADHPVLDREVVRQLLAARVAHPERSIVLPTYEGQRGHPALIAWKHVAALHAWPAESGLNVYLRQQRAETCELPVTSATVVLDVDTPEDLEQLRKRFRVGGGSGDSVGIPTESRTERAPAQDTLGRVRGAGDTNNESRRPPRD